MLAQTRCRQEIFRAEIEIDCAWTTHDTAAQTLYALRTLRAHGMDDAALQTVFRSVVIAKLTYASSAWWDFATTTDRQRLPAFIRRSYRSRFVSPSLPPTDELCRASDDKLFASITNNREHVLHELIPPQSVASQNYNLRPRKHHFELPNKTSHLTDCNFIQRMLFLETYWLSILSCYFHFISFIYSSLILTCF